MANKALPCPTVLRQLLRYEPETGKLFWKERPAWMFRDRPQGGRTGAASRWNARCVGKEALSVTHGNGYMSGGINGRKIYAHRAIWALVHGCWPDVIDHINGVRSDNKLANLRAITKAENSRNSGIPATNTSGVVGVSFVPASQKWAAYIWDKKKISLGVHSTFEAAVSARKSAEITMGYHPNHGDTRENYT